MPSVVRGVGRLRVALVEIGDDRVGAMDDGFAVDERRDRADAGGGFHGVPLRAVERDRAGEPVEAELRETEPDAMRVRAPLRLPELEHGRKRRTPGTKPAQTRHVFGRTVVA